MNSLCIRTNVLLKLVLNLYWISLTTKNLKLVNSSDCLSRIILYPTWSTFFVFFHLFLSSKKFVYVYFLFLASLCKNRISLHFHINIDIISCEFLSLEKISQNPFCTVQRVDLIISNTFFSLFLQQLFLFFKKQNFWGKSSFFLSDRIILLWNWPYWNEGNLNKTHFKVYLSLWAFLSFFPKPFFQTGWQRQNGGIQE